MNNAIRADKNLMLKAHWEEKTDKTIRNNLVRDRIADMQKRKASDLNMRKSKLAALLAAEDKQYEQEFMDNLETPEQVRAKMAQKLEGLKA